MSNIDTACDLLSWNATKELSNVIEGGLYLIIIVEFTILMYGV